MADVGELRGRPLLCQKPRNLNRRGRWPLVSVEKDSHAQPPLAAMAVFPLLALPPEEQLAFGLRLFFWLGSACKLGAGSCCLVESTAADRAAADVRRGGSSLSHVLYA